MANVRTATLRVPGADLHYEARGAGPVLLISDSGGGEVRRSNEIAAELADAFTVVTYDRRGFARSAQDQPGTAVPVATHAEDLRLLLIELTERPAHVLGCALGVLPALTAALEQPDLFATVIAHEPLAPALLTGADRAEHIAAFEELEADYRTHGLPAAVVRISRMLGAGAANQRRVQDSLDRDAGARTAPSDPAVAGQRTANFDFILRNEIPCARTAVLDTAALREVAPRVVAAVGAATPPELFGSRCAHALGAAVGAGVVRFPGGHNAHFTHPVEYARRLREVLEQRSVRAAVAPQ
ncbi:alpha/beta fold hydrolase [Nocardia sp. CA-135953]|uniref:alpha/beta fold hydrolase n=1 Tax=Nocardia sp. CA-135953 TaxID=3239978 RepID=UPI003D991D01